MSDTVIRIENVSKKYIIGTNGAGSDGLRHAIHDLFTAPFKNGKQSANTNQRSEEFWALKDISFDVKQGEVVGIIGRNGAGKSTLLKILSRITEPTTGRLGIRGRVASLLEVGTGFHPELTGRENVFLNGAILGMSREEIKRKFDEIVAFAEIEKFIDTPVKRYSSGMYVRLAFAVAAHLEPEILIVDEVLAVGDAQFQKKCLGKMGEVAKEGRTVLFVTHSLSAIRKLCQRGIVLVRGEKCFDGAASGATSFYSGSGTLTAISRWSRSGTADPMPLAFEEITIAMLGEQPNLKLRCDIKIRCNQPCKRSFVAVDVCDAALSPIMQALPEATPFIEGLPGLHRIQLEVDLPSLIPGIYMTDFWVGSHYSTTQDYVRQALAFEVSRGPSDDRTFPYSSDHGCIVPTSRYTYTKRHSESGVRSEL